VTDDRRVQHDLDVRRNERARELLALRRLGRRLEAEARLLDRRLRELGERHDRAARLLEAEYRRTHFNKSPVSWQHTTPSGADGVLRSCAAPRTSTAPPRRKAVGRGAAIAP
jgi:hypothetical protein